MLAEAAHWEGVVAEQVVGPSPWPAPWGTQGAAWPFPGFGFLGSMTVGMNLVFLRVPST